jgi:(S)-ureidoglycine aminohydrolase
MKKVLLLFILAGLATAAFAQDDYIPSDNYRWKDLKVVKQDTRKTRQILDGPTVFMERFEIHATTLQPGMAPHAAHKHDTEEEMVIIKEGRVQVTIEDETRVLGPGSIAFAEIGDMHGFSNAGDTEATYYVIKMKGRGNIDHERGKKAGGSFMIDYEDLEFKPHDKGGLRNYFRRSTALFDYFEMHMTTLNPTIQSHPPHTHRAAEIILIMDGKVVESIDGQDYKGQQGDLFYLASEIPHGITNRSKKKTCRYFAFQWSE